MGAIDFIPLALEGQWRGWAAGAVVATAALVFIGSIYILLLTLYGAKTGFHVLMVSLMGFSIILSAIWLFGAPGTIPGTGPRGSEPHWVPFLTESEQATDFRDSLESFPSDWDEIGKAYPGGIESTGEFTTAKSAVTEALARLAAFQGLEATAAADWDFRPKGVPPTSVREEALPEASVRFLQRGGTLLFGADIPATARHRAVTVFAFRDKGRVFLPAAVFFSVSVALFALHTSLLAREERRAAARAQAGAPAV